jgi:hypothetical protein
MISYTSSFINEYYQSLENKTLDAQLLDSLNSILTTINNDMSLNAIENEYEFRFKKTKSKSKSNDYYYQQQQSASFNTFNSVRCQKKKEETKTQIEVVKSTLKSILNKLSPSNYTKLENDLVIIGGKVDISPTANIKGQSLFVGGETNLNAKTDNPVKIGSKLGKVVLNFRQFLVLLGETDVVIIDEKNCEYK